MEKNKKEKNKKTEENNEINFPPESEMPEIPAGHAFLKDENGCYIAPLPPEEIEF